MNRERALIKLQAIRDKDTKAIFDKKTFLPMIGVPSSEQQVKDWLKVREDTLVSALNCKSDTEINQLLTAEQTAFNKNPNDYLPSGTKKASELSPTEFDSLCRIRLLKLASGENEKL